MNKSLKDGTSFREREWEIKWLIYVQQIKEEYMNFVLCVLGFSFYGHYAQCLFLSQVNSC